MMLIDACLVDTNVLLRIARRSDPNHSAVNNALAKLAIQGVFSAEMRRSEAVALGYPVMPVLDGLPG
jgi:hypothetical protein